MRSFQIIITVLLMLTFSTQAQQSKRIQYFGSLQTGFAAGSSDFDYSIQTLHGIQHKSWIGALGTGYDGYGVPGIPLTFYGQKNFTQLKHKPFAYAQTGIEIPLKVKDWAAKDFNNIEVYDLKQSYIAEAGIGYQWKLGRKIQLVVNTGFCFKYNKVGERQLKYPPWASFMPPDGSPEHYNFNTLEYYYKRIVCRFGIVF